jgi:hypothetical protein
VWPRQASEGFSGNLQKSKRPAVDSGVQVREAPRRADAIALLDFLTDSLNSRVLLFRICFSNPFF